MKDLPHWLYGGAGASSPLWLNSLTTGWQIVIAIMGFIVLSLTIYNKILEIRQRKKNLAED